MPNKPPTQTNHYYRANLSGRHTPDMSAATDSCHNFVVDSHTSSAARGEPVIIERSAPDYVRSSVCVERRKEGICGGHEYGLKPATTDFNAERDSCASCRSE